MDTTQIVLLSVIIVLSIFLVVLGVQLFFVLKDLRKSLSRMNRLFDDADQLVSEVKKPIAKASNLFMAFSTGASIVNILKKGKRK